MGLEEEHFSTMIVLKFMTPLKQSFPLVCYHAIKQAHLRACYSEENGKLKLTSHIGKPDKRATK